MTDAEKLKMDIDYMLSILECADIFDEYSRYDDSESDIEDDD